MSSFRGNWELYDMTADRTELTNLAARMPRKVKELAQLWQNWANRVGAVPWEQLPGSNYQPTKSYRKRSEVVP